MCGIVGFVRHAPSSDAAAALLNTMCAAIQHRGPDAQGTLAGAEVGIGMRRLAIIDLVGGAQPMLSREGRYAIVFNGEIYNYRELNAQLAARGHAPTTASDTETLLLAYLTWGADCLHRLNGMFAFAIWDRHTDEMFLARDRVGKKPLYTRSDPGGRVAFASEVRALRTLPGLSWTLNTDAIHHYLSLQYIPAPHSLWREVQVLPPGHYAIIRDGHLTTHRYWSLDYTPKHSDTWPDLRDALRAHIREAVRLRLRSDVPLGVFLSGGLDSAIILAEMAAQLDRPVQAFTIGFDEAAFDESGYAAQVAARHGAQHHVFPLRLDAARDLPLLVRWQDEPFANPSALPTFYLAQHTRQHVTVALSGDGSDEVFGGYQRYLLDQLAQPLALLPSGVWGALAGAAATVLRPPHNVPTEANWRLGLQRLPQVFAMPRAASLLRWGSFFSAAMKHALYTDAMRAATAHIATAELLAADYAAARATTALDRTLHTDVVNYLSDDGMVKVDRMSMANSLEVRNPYLDVNVLAFAARLPVQAKLHRRTQKRLLREAYADVLPPSVVKRPKRGFAVPVSQWLGAHGPLAPLAREVLLAPDAATRPWFRADALAALFDAHAARHDDHGKRLWALLVLELWLREHV